MFSVKVHKVGGEVLVACCDLDILGKRLSDGKLDLHVNEGFYGGEKMDKRRLAEVMREATVANLLGDEIVGLALERGLIEEDGVIEVCGVKHAQLYCLDEKH